eukprot:491562_1
MSNWNVYTLHRFLQFREKSVHCLRTQENGDFIGVIFTCGDAEIHDLRKDNTNDTRKTLLRLRNVIDLCFISIPITSILDGNETENKQNKDNIHSSHNNGYKNGLLIARQNSSDEFIRLGMFIEYEIGHGWIEIPISVELHNNLYQLISTRYGSRQRKPFEIPITSISGYILRGYGNIISMCSNDFDSIYVWRIIINKYEHQSCLISPISIKVGNKKQIYCMVITKHALFASDLECMRISPAPSVLWDGALTLAVPKIYKLSVITSQLVAAINDKNNLFIFGVDRKNQNFKAFFVTVSTPLPVAHCTSFPIGNLPDNNGKDDEKKQDIQIKDKDKNMMGWTANKYLFSLKTPNYPQLFVVVLDSMFVQSILRAKDSKRMVKLTNYPSKIVCTFSNTLQIVPLYPDMILIPNQHDIHAFLFTFK